MTQSSFLNISKNLNFCRSSVCLPLRKGKTCLSGAQTSSRCFLSCKFRLLCGPSTHSAILFPSSRLGGCELAVKRTRPPLVWFMSLDCWPLLSSHSGSGSLGTHAALSPSCSEKEGHRWVPLQCCRLMYAKVQATTSCFHRVPLCDTKDASFGLFFFCDTILYHCIWSISANTTGMWCWMYSRYL